MQTFISCNQPQLARRLQQSLAKLDIRCSGAQILSHHTTSQALEDLPHDATVLLFFCSEALSSEDLSSLERLCDKNVSGLRIVVIGQSFNASAILSAIRLGAVDCIQVSSSFDSDLHSLLDRMQRGVSGKKRLGRLITVVGACGGSGASLISLNLAAHLAQRTSTCALLDLHWRGGDLAALMNVAPKHTLLSLAEKVDQLDRSMFEQTIVKHESGICLLASPEPFSDCRQMRAELIQKIVHIARMEYAHVVVDLENCDHEDQVRTLAASDKIVIPLRPDVVSLVKTQKLIKYLTSSGVNLTNLSIVTNRVGQKKSLPVELIGQTLQVQRTFTLPDDSVAVNESINVGIPLVIGRPKSRIAESLIQLSDSLSDHSRSTLAVPSGLCGRINSKLIAPTMRSVAQALTTVGVRTRRTTVISEGRQYA